MDISLYLLAVVIGTPIAVFVFAILRQDRIQKIIDAAPKCKDCEHCTYLSSNDFGDRHKWGIQWSSDSGYYCKLSEYSISSGGQEVTGFDKKRMHKCKDYRRWKRCGPSAKLFSAKDSDNDCL
jgi:hypothetical protein